MPVELVHFLILQPIPFDGLDDILHEEVNRNHSNIAAI